MYRTVPALMLWSGRYLSTQLPTLSSWPGYLVRPISAPCHEVLEQYYRPVDSLARPERLFLVPVPDQEYADPGFGGIRPAGWVDSESEPGALVESRATVTFGSDK